MFDAPLAVQAPTTVPRPSRLGIPAPNCGRQGRRMVLLVQAVDDDIVAAHLTASSDSVASKHLFLCCNSWFAARAILNLFPLPDYLLTASAHRVRLLTLVSRANPLPTTAEQPGPLLVRLQAHQDIVKPTYAKMAAPASVASPSDGEGDEHQGRDADLDSEKDFLLSEPGSTDSVLDLPDGRGVLAFASEPFFDPLHRGPDPPHGGSSTLTSTDNVHISHGPARKSKHMDAVGWRDLPRKRQLVVITLARLSEPLVQTSLQVCLPSLACRVSQRLTDYHKVLYVLSAKMVRSYPVGLGYSKSSRHLEC